MTKKLSVAKAGYFTRKMVSFLYPYRITEDDCRANSGFVLSRAFFDELNEEDPSTFPLDRFILGRYIKTNGKWELIDEKRLEKIKKDSTWQQLEIRSPLTCQTKTGVCKKCYGADIARPGIAEEALPQKGEFVGLSAGHVIGEFGTQFSMKAFQTGADFSTDRLSSVFFERQKTYPEYLKHIHKAKEDESLFKTIEVFSIHMELLYRYMTLNDVYSENDMKEKLKDWKNHGLLSALSFEGTKGILKDDVLQAVLNLQESISEIQLEEKSPSVYYMFSNPHIKELLTNG